MKEQTPLERLIEILSKPRTLDEWDSFDDIEEAKLLLPEERKVIEGAHKAGQLSASVAASDSEATEYFTTKFKQ